MMDTADNNIVIIIIYYLLLLLSSSSLLLLIISSYCPSAECLKLTYCFVNARFRSRTFHEPNLIRSNADPKY